MIETDVKRKTKARFFFPRRYFMIMGTFLLSLLLYIDRICISVAKEPITGALGLSEVQMGWVLSVFALGYALFQTPAGLLADRFGPRTILTAVVCFWSFFTALTAAAWSFVSLLVIRFLFGAGEAGAFPGIARAAYSWIPVSERGITHGINFSGSRLGAAFALPMVAWLIASYGWRFTFVFLGVIGFAWAAAWYLLFRDDPMGHPDIPQEEKDHISRNRQQKAEANPALPPLRASTLFGSRNMWLAMVQYFFSNFTFFFCLTWLFPHLQQKYDLTIMEAGYYASAPLVFGAFGNWVSGWWIDRIYRNGNLTLSRRLPAIVGFALAAIGLFFSVYMDSAFGAIAFLSLAIFGADMTLSPSWSFCIDIGRDHSGLVSGTMNMAGNLGAFLTALAFPYLQLLTGSEVPFFFLGAAFNVLAIGAWLYMRPEKSIQEG
jgi:MFS transporter, ACS family, glucarate transporter